MTTTQSMTEWEAERGPNFRFSMYSRAGNDAVATAVDALVAKALAGEVTRRTLRREYDLLLKAVAKGGFREVYDTEPEWAVADDLNDRICKPLLWLAFSRWDDNEG